MARKVIQNNQYWSNAFIAIGQVFLGVAAGTFFTGTIDLYRALVVISNLIISVIFFWIGGKLSK
jgi:hypothetical protein